MLMKFFSVSALLQTNFFRRSGTPTWVPYTHNIDIIVGACSRYEKFIWFTILTSFDSRYWHHSINQPILIQIHQNHPSLFVFLQEWKALSPLFSSYQQYQPNFEQNTKLDLKDFPLRFCVVSQDPSKKGVSQYSFSLPSNVRALYCQDPMRGEEWKQLISDFDTKLLQWKDWSSFAVFVWWCWCNVYFFLWGDLYIPPTSKGPMRNQFNILTRIHCIHRIQSSGSTSQMLQRSKSFRVCLLRRRSPHGRMNHPPFKIFLITTSLRTRL